MRADAGTTVANDRAEAATERHLSLYSTREERYGLDAPTRDEAVER